MKELSIEEKAKAYDKAIEKAKDALNDGTISSNTIVYLQDIFPELAESEDEKIRKEIRAFIKSRGSKISQSKTDAWLAWLEKQGEHKPAEWSEEDEDVINRLLAICAGAKRYRQFAGCLQEDITKYQTWLKSLRPQSTWKPSDEQIEALESATENCAYSEYQDCLRELIGQLKKLREK